MSFAALNRVAAELGALCKNSGDVAVMLLQADAANDAGLAWKTQTTIARSLPVSRQAVNAAHKRISDRGLWDTHEYYDERGHKRLLIRFRLDPETDGVEPITAELLPKGVTLDDLPTEWLTDPSPLQRTRPQGDAHDGASQASAGRSTPRADDGRFASQAATSDHDAPTDGGSDPATDPDAPQPQSATADKALSATSDQSGRADQSAVLAGPSPAHRTLPSRAERTVSPSRSTKGSLLPAAAGEHTSEELGVALEDHCLTGDAGAVGAAAKQLLDAGATPDEIAVRARRLADRWGPAAVTAPSLAKWWPSLAGDPAGPSLPERRPTTDTAADVAHRCGLAGMPWGDVAEDLESGGHDPAAIAAAREAFDRATNRGAA